MADLLVVASATSSPLCTDMAIPTDRMAVKWTCPSDGCGVSSRSGTKHVYGCPRDRPLVIDHRAYPKVARWTEIHEEDCCAEHGYTMLGCCAEGQVDDTLLALQRRQADPNLHPYTCANRSDGKHRTTTDLGVLTPTLNGWICEDCDYTQPYQSGRSVMVGVIVELVEITGPSHHAYWTDEPDAPEWELCCPDAAPYGWHTPTGTVTPIEPVPCERMLVSQVRAYGLISSLEHAGHIANGTSPSVWVADEATMQALAR